MVVVASSAFGEEYKTMSSDRVPSDDSSTVSIVQMQGQTRLKLMSNNKIQMRCILPGLGQSFKMKVQHKLGLSQLGQRSQRMKRILKNPLSSQLGTMGDFAMSLLDPTLSHALTIGKQLGDSGIPNIMNTERGNVLKNLLPALCLLLKDINAQLSGPIAERRYED
ncbi:hypothetical protein VNO77_03395 [Canavalia gladiata]|uniref:Uncharacterized protein n=1 Tax=Canavalia gladiata TaxID=3824 RepID=A0AAN9N128_CANGL